MERGIDQWDVGSEVNTANTYIYTVNATAPCANSTAAVVVSVETVHNPGTNGLDTLCTGDASINLFTLLGNGPDTGGTWAGPGGSASTGAFDPASSQQGTYTYSFTGGVCADVSSAVQMTVLPGPNAGQNNAVALCDAGPTVNLLGLLSGIPEPGGSWVGPDGLSTAPWWIRPRRHRVPIHTPLTATLPARMRRPW